MNESWKWHRERGRPLRPARQGSNPARKRAKPPSSAPTLFGPPSCARDPRRRPSLPTTDPKRARGLTFPAPISAAGLSPTWAAAMDLLRPHARAKWMSISGDGSFHSTGDVQRHRTWTTTSFLPPRTPGGPATSPLPERRFVHDDLSRACIQPHPGRFHGSSCWAGLPMERAHPDFMNNWITVAASTSKAGRSNETMPPPSRDRNRYEALQDRKTEGRQRDRSGEVARTAASSPDRASKYSETRGPDRTRGQRTSKAGERKLDGPPSSGAIKGSKPRSKATRRQARLQFDDDEKRQARCRP